MPRRRAMPSDVASRKKVTGHKNERSFAAIIGGDVGRLPHTGKTDVRDQHGRTFSVKGGTWWQIFLYRRSRFETNTVFRGTGIGRVPELMVACIDAFPEHRHDYTADRDAAKLRLQIPMRQLRDELRDTHVLLAFLEKALFNGGEVDYLAILPTDLTNEPDAKKEFHVFARRDVVRYLSDLLAVANSQAHAGRSDQFDDQKVIFRYKGRNCGEFEIRTDSDAHYREAKFRLNGPTILRLLTHRADSARNVGNQMTVYGAAVRTLSSVRKH